MRKAVVIVSLGFVALGCAAFIAVPAYLQHRAINEAAEHGITLGIERTRITVDGAHFEGLTATTVQIPNAKIHIDEIAVGWSGTTAIATGMQVTADGPITPPNAAAVDNLIQKQSAGPTTLRVRSAHILWTHAFGDASVEFANVDGDLALGPTFRETFAWTTDISVAYAGRTIGPFSAELTHLNGEETLQLFADPADHASENLTISNVGVPGPRTYELLVDQRPLSKLGIPLDLFGINIAGDPKIHLHIVDHIERPPSASRLQGNGSFDLVTDPIALPGLPAPAPVTIDVAWSGNPDQAVPVHDSSLQIDPFHGPIIGTISRPEGGIVLDLSFASQAVPCSKFGAQNPLQSLLGGSALGAAVASMTGAQGTVTGDVKLAGSVQFDSTNPGARRATFAPVTNCGISISLGSGGK
ncbi:MAG: hypothetical protein ABI183_02640 [Polyangiaceae bacterium]